MRVTHVQNLVLPHVRKRDLFAIWQQLGRGGPGDRQCRPDHRHHRLPRHGLLRARHRPLDPDRAGDQQRFADAERQALIGELSIKISGCINACGHHHVGHIGILGLDKRGDEFYQITLGGGADENAAIGEIVGPGFSAEQVPDAIERIVDTYLELRSDDDERSSTPSAAPASSRSRRSSMPLLKAGRFVTDHWRVLADDEAVPDEGKSWSPWRGCLPRRRRPRPSAPSSASGLSPASESSRLSPGSIAWPWWR